ncbi:alpha/beta hydrolase family protein [uncultured Microbacterium sp.]|uniref:alpha/beta hydrolase family protein n=1 Tax=uncultured Microbacterium sp. TaxID=191216 RepID=UPI0026030CAD|nr:alpha/beta family hydrolase [uncultured Microbacterium sp.]
MTLSVDLPAGTVQLPSAWSPVTGRGTVVIAHGAGAGMGHPFLVGFADALNDLGFSTLRFEFAYRAMGRRMQGPAPHAIAAWRAAVAHARALAPGDRIWACGKSYGGRMASMAVAEGLETDGLIYLGYPLHAPGKPEKPRAEHLPAVAVPQLFIEGTTDPFVQPREQLEDVITGCQDARIVWIENANHSFEIRGNKREASVIGASLAPLVAEFLV